MVALETPSVQQGWKAPAFRLQATDNKWCTLEDICGKQGTVIIFMCNHCPYVQAVLDRLVATARELQAMEVGVAAIMSNDASQYPDDSFENMRKLADSKKFSFPYLYDQTQEVAKAYDAVCTPDFFGFNANLELQYRGRFDESWSLAKANPRRELWEAMQAIAKTGNGPSEQHPSIGCSIKWR